MQAGDRNTFFEDRKLGTTVEGGEPAESLLAAARRRPTDDLEDRAALSVSEEKVFGQDPLATEFFTTLMESLILAQDECWRHA